jgi:hypothetical protein
MDTLNLGEQYGVRRMRRCCNEPQGAMPGHPLQMMHNAEWIMKWPDFSNEASLIRKQRDSFAFLWKWWLSGIEHVCSVIPTLHEKEYLVSVLLRL